MPQRYRYPLAWTGLWLGLLLVTLYARPLMPIDETRYAAVAWEMWLRNTFIVPHLNGETYSHKPPLLFWLIQLGWSAFGVHGWVARSVSPLFGLASLFLTASLARRLWPDDHRTASIAPLVVLSCIGWTVFTTVLMFDMLIACFTLLGLLGLLRAWQEGGRLGWIILGLAIGLGILAKGPVILVYILPTALLAPWWMADQRPANWKGWYWGILASVGIGAAIALCWVLPAAWLGGQEYRDAILWGQTAGRMVDSFAHRRPWWWYLPLLPALLFPWSIWLPVWQGLKKASLDWGGRFCLSWLLSGLLAFSLISGKQIHYLLPLMPAFALLVSRGIVGIQPGRLARWLPAIAVMVLGVTLIGVSLLEAFHELPPWTGEVSPWWGLVLIFLGWLLGSHWLRAEGNVVEVLALSSIAVLAIINLGILRPAHAYYDVSPASRHLAELQSQDIAIAHLGSYSGQFQFGGRLDRPIDTIEPHEVSAWALRHPEGRLISYANTLDAQKAAQAEFCQPYRGRYLLIWTGEALSQHPELLNRTPNPSSNSRTTSEIPVCGRR